MLKFTSFVTLIIFTAVVTWCSFQEVSNINELDYPEFPSKLT